MASKKGSEFVKWSTALFPPPLLLFRLFHNISCQERLPLLNYLVPEKQQHLLWLSTEWTCEEGKPALRLVSEVRTVEFIFVLPLSQPVWFQRWILGLCFPSAHPLDTSHFAFFVYFKYFLHLIEKWVSVFFFSFFWLQCTAWGILVPKQRSNRCPLRWKSGVCTNLQGSPHQPEPLWVHVPRAKSPGHQWESRVCISYLEPGTALKPDSMLVIYIHSLAVWMRVLFTKNWRTVGRGVWK